ncbi:MAG: TetR/AcrR family transcriptional regulator, partial [Firmicutes bacterium]|nr:TetR/AcrR family transcriptional regulator [Bacillota bacterium]
MYKTCVTQPAKQRQRELENGLLQIMLHHDYEAISVSDLCDTLQIPRKSFYRYFTNKD